MKIRKMAKFWQGFFETAANVSLSPQSAMDQEPSAGETSSQTITSDDQEETSAMSYDDQRGGREADYSLDSAGSGQGDDSMDDSVDQEAFLASLNQKTRNLSIAPDSQPEQESQRAPVESPFERLRKELEGDFEKQGNRKPKHPYPQGNSLAPDQHKLSKEIAELGQRKTTTTTTTPKAPSHKAVTRILESAGKRSGGPRNVGRVQATPRGKTNPFATLEQADDDKQSTQQAVQQRALSTSPSKWNGIADLRKTPLSKVRDKKKQRADGKARKEEWELSDDDAESSFGLPAGMSPPVTMQFSVPRSRYAKTPAKQAAQLMVDDLLKSVQANSPAARARAQKLRDSQRRQDSGLKPGAASSSSPSPKPSLINTPLKKVASSSRKRRDSLPTPPTITKRMDATKTFGTSTTPSAAPSNLLSGSMAASTSTSSIGSSSAAKLLDQDEDGRGGDLVGEGEEDEEEEEEVPEDLGTGLSKVAMAKTSAGVDKLLQVDDEEDSDEESEDDYDEEEEEEEEEEKDLGTGEGHRGQRRTKTTVASPLTNSSLASSSRNIDQDTLFGIRDVAHEVPSPGASGNSHFRPMGQVDETVYNGRPLLSEGRDDTYSAPSPTPFGKR